MRRSAIFWGFVFITGGLLLLLQNLHILTFNIWEIIWPIFLVALGIYILSGWFLRNRPENVEQLSVPLQGASQARMWIRHGAGRLSIEGTASDSEIVTGSFGGGVDDRVRMNGNTLEIDLRVPTNGVIWWGDWSSRDWRLALNSQTPISLDLETGASETIADLTPYCINELRLKTGASSTQLTTPAMAGLTRAFVESGAASVSLRIPQGVAARIRVRSGLAGIAVDQTRFPRQGDVYLSPNFDQSPNRIDLDIQTGVGAVDIS